MLSWIRHTLGERDYSCREEKCNITLISIHRDIGEKVTFIKIKKQCQGKRKINNFSELTTRQRCDQTKSQKPKILFPILMMLILII